MREDLRARLRNFTRSPTCQKTGVTGVTGVTPPTEPVERLRNTPSHPTVTRNTAEKAQQNQSVTPVTPVTPEFEKTATETGACNTGAGVTVTPPSGVLSPDFSAEDWLAAFHERSGLLEFDCHLTRAEADRMTLAEMGEPPFGAANRIDLNIILRRPSETRH